MTAMKSRAITASKSAVRKQKKGAFPETTVMQRKIKRSFAEQVDDFIERYRPALEALAKR